MQPLKNCIGPTTRIGREILCLPYAGCFSELFNREYFSLAFRIKNTHQKATNLMFCLNSPVAKIPAWFLEGQY